MNYEHYIQEGDEYALKPRGKFVLYLWVAIFALVGIGFLVSGFRNHVTNGYTWGLAFLALSVLLFSFIKKRRPTFFIQPALNRVVTKKRSGEIKYEFSFDKFLNFHTVNTYTNGILTGRQVYIYFDDNGKNRSFILGNVYRNKSVDRLIEETSQLMGNDGRQDVQPKSSFPSV